MTPVPSFRVAAMLVLVIAVMLIASCSDDKTTNTNGDGEDLLRQTAQGLLQQYTESLEAADLEAYAECLDQAYKFVFTPQDAEDLGLPPNEPWWLRIEDLASTAGMFAHDDLHSIQVDLTVVDQDTTEIEGEPVITIQVDPVILVILIPPGEEPTYLNVTGTWLYFDVVPDSDDDRLWAIAEIEEEAKVPLSLAPAVPAGSVDPLTFGDIKVIFR